MTRYRARMHSSFRIAVRPAVCSHALSFLGLFEGDPAPPGPSDNPLHHRPPAPPDHSAHNLTPGPLRWTLDRSGGCRTTLVAPVYRVARGHVEFGQIRAHVMGQSTTPPVPSMPSWPGARPVYASFRRQPVGNASDVGASVAPDVSSTS